MNPDYKDGIIRLMNDVICLFNSEGKYLQELYNYKTKAFPHNLRIYMPKEFYLPILVDQPTRYLIMSDGIILTKP